MQRTTASCVFSPMTRSARARIPGVALRTATRRSAPAKSPSSFPLSPKATMRRAPVSARSYSTPARLDTGVISTKQSSVRAP